jgi:hypothetical protein
MNLAAHRRGDFCSTVFGWTIALLVVASPANADLLVFTGESLSQNALAPLLDFGRGGSRSLLPYSVNLATVGVENDSILMLAVPTGELRLADDVESGIVLRSESGLSLALRDWVAMRGNVVLLPGDLLQISPATLDRAHLAAKDGSSTSLVATGTLEPVPEASFRFSFLAGVGLLVAANHVRARRGHRRSPPYPTGL